MCCAVWPHMHAGLGEQYTNFMYEGNYYVPSVDYPRKDLEWCDTEPSNCCCIPMLCLHVLFNTCHWPIYRSMHPLDSM